MAIPRRKYVLDTNCFIDAARDATFAAALEAFCAAGAPALYLSSVVAAELRAGARTVAARRELERLVIGPYARRGRVLTPSPASWAALGDALAALAPRRGANDGDVKKSFVLDILIAHSCREAGAILISRNARDLNRIARVFPFEHTAPFPALTARA